MKKCRWDLSKLYSRYLHVGMYLPRWHTTCVPSNKITWPPLLNNLSPTALQPPRLVWTSKDKTRWVWPWPKPRVSSCPPFNAEILSEVWESNYLSFLSGTQLRRSAHCVQPLPTWWKRTVTNLLVRMITLSLFYRPSILTFRQMEERLWSGIFVSTSKSTNSRHALLSWQSYCIKQLVVNQPAQHSIGSENRQPWRSRHFISTRLSHCETRESGQGDKMPLQNRIARSDRILDSVMIIHHHLLDEWARRPYVHSARKKWSRPRGMG